MTRQVCPFHADEDVLGVLRPDGVEFHCPRPHAETGGGALTWLSVPEPTGVPESTGLAAELGLRTELPAAIGTRPGEWLEYGVVEHAYATARKHDFDLLVEKYGHTAIEAKRYTASAFLAAALGRLSREGVVLYKPGRATGRWDYNSDISWWAVPGTSPDARDVAWASLGVSMDYVPGSTEVCPSGRCTVTNPADCAH